jgi:amino acid adenylation domain-containing protein
MHDTVARGVVPKQHAEELKREFPELSSILDLVARCGAELPDVLRGRRDPLDLLFPNGSFAQLEAVYRDSPLARMYNTLAQEAVAATVSARLQEAPRVRILEIGAGVGGTTSSILPKLPAEQTDYVFTDLSELFLARARSRFREFSFVSYRIFNVENDPVQQGLLEHGYDIVLAANVLHATKDISASLQNVRALLAPRGLLVLIEMTNRHLWADLVFGLTEGWWRFSDIDLRPDYPLLSRDDWRSVLRNTGFIDPRCIPDDSLSVPGMDQAIILAAAPEFDISSWNIGRSETVSRSITVGRSSETPLISTGIDRASLAALPENRREEALGAFLANQFATLIEANPARIDVHAPVSSLGFDSIMALELKNTTEALLGLNVPVSALLEGQSIAQLAKALAGQLASDPATDRGAETDRPITLRPDPVSRCAPFPLTEIQEAYWVGRSDSVELGNVSAHAYIEIDVRDLDLARLESSWRVLVERHDMLRAIITPSGENCILREVPAYRIESIDLSKLKADELERALHEAREAMSHRVLPADQWPLFELRAHRLGENITRVHIGIDFLVADALSLRILLTEWAVLYSSPYSKLESLTVSYRDYVLWEREWRQGPAYRESERYWLARLDDLPPGPELGRKAWSGGRPRFGRRSGILCANDWRALKARAARVGLTPSLVLCAAFTEALYAWSKIPRFTINLTLFNRMPAHPQINALVGDFTTTILLEADGRERSGGFEARARRLQDQLWRDLEHRHMSGVRVLRELARRQGRAAQPAMPVVFTSTLGHDDGDQETFPTAWLGEIVYGVSQTPQVWLDHQVYERGGDLMFNWDAVEDLFPPGLLDAMFEAYCALLRRLASEEPLWSAPHLDLRPAADRDLQLAANATAGRLPEGLLHSPSFARAEQKPDRVAVISGEHRLSYDALRDAALRIAGWLRRNGAGRGQLVAVVMRKGWEQAAAVLGVLEAGAAYLPIDPALPAERIAYLLQHGDARCALTQSDLATSLAWPSDVERLVVSQETLNELQPADAGSAATEATDLAYVIFTSGSTGVPKGVMIAHRGALNTVIDVNERFAVGPEDRILALSSLGFDLSVYDLFGAFAAGAVLVMPSPESERDPAHWVDLMREERVTIWNSAPALMEMLVEYAEAHPGVWPPTLRLVLLSGDWIPITLPARLAALSPSMQVVSLGGATEASIWSIIHPIARVEENWTSIPYGRPMRNQNFYVLNAGLEPCPVWTTGELYIGGVGLAEGYWKDPEKTAERFIRHPEMGERLYRTGDLGRWLPSGEIEFLGREDFQVKIRGHRIELGEVESVLARHPQTQAAIVIADGPRREERRLIAYVAPKSGERLDSEELRAHAQRSLPAYMVPAAFIVLEKLPISQNGKINRAALPKADVTSRSLVAPRNASEQQLHDLWRLALDRDDFGVTEDFFELGGNSLLAVRLLGLIRQTFGYDVPIASLFRGPTIERLADLLRSRDAETEDHGPLVLIRKGNTRSPLFCMHPVGGNVLCYSALARKLDSDLPLYAIQSPALSGDAANAPRSIETMAADYMAAIRKIQPHGPYRLSGWSMGGVIAFEMARQIEAMGETVSLLALIDAYPDECEIGAREALSAAALAAMFAAELGATTGLELGDGFPPIGDLDDPENQLALANYVQESNLIATGATPEQIQTLLRAFMTNEVALRNYTPASYGGGVILLRASTETAEARKTYGGGWETWVRGQIDTVVVPGTHYSIMREPGVEKIAETLSRSLAGRSPNKVG